MTEKRYSVIQMEGIIYPIYFDGDKELDEGEVCNLLNELYDENEQLKKENQKLKTQLLHGDDVCDICKHKYLMPTDDYFIVKCRKGHEECSKEDIKYCEDFEFKGLEKEAKE